MRTAIGSKRAIAVRRAALQVWESLETRRMLSAGALDTSFGNGGTVITDVPGPNADLVAGAAHNGSGYLVVGNTFGSESKAHLARYSSVGARDTSFGSGGVVVMDSSTLSDAEAVATD